MLELTENLVGAALKILLQPSRHYVHGEEVMWIDTTEDTKTESRGMLFLFNDALCYTVEEPQKNTKKVKQKIQQVMTLSAATISWRGYLLVIRYDSLTKHNIEFSFKSEKAATVTRQFLQQVVENRVAPSGTSASVFKKI